MKRTWRKKIGAVVALLAAVALGDLWACIVS